MATALLGDDAIRLRNYHYRLSTLSTSWNWIYKMTQCLAATAWQTERLMGNERKNQLEKFYILFTVYHSSMKHEASAIWKVWKEVIW